MLAKKMPSFAENEQHRESHKKIHDGVCIHANYVPRDFFSDFLWSFPPS